MKIAVEMALIRRMLCNSVPFLPLLTVLEASDIHPDQWFLRQSVKETYKYGEYK